MESGRVRQGTLEMDPPAIGFTPEAEVPVDLRQLLAGRLVLTASSGAGKSYVLRQIAEELCQTIPQLIIDWEGEFDSLKEIHPYVIIGALEDGADIHAELGTARAIIRRLMIAKASVIVDVSEMDVDERREYVGLVLDELMKLKREHRHPRLVVIDEAHEFCPQGESVASSKAVKAVVARGRKRGFGSIIATQRLSKLHKDAAESANTLTGQTVLDVDLERAGDALGFNRRQLSEIERLKPGQFWAKGRAFSPAGEVMLVRSGTVRTRHPDGTAAAAVVPLPHEIAEALQSLESIQRDPTEDADRQELLEQIARLESQLKAAKEGNSSDPADIRRAVDSATRPLQDELHCIRLQIERMKAQARLILLDVGELPPNPETGVPRTEIEAPILEAVPDVDPPADSALDSGLTQIQSEMLSYLTTFGEVASDALAIDTAQGPRSSSFRTNRKRLVDLGLAEYMPGRRGWIRLRGGA